jgi:hypothetical protein
LRICRRILPRPHCNSYWLCVSGGPALNRAISGILGRIEPELRLAFSKQSWFTRGGSSPWTWEFLLATRRDHNLAVANQRTADYTLGGFICETRRVGLRRSDDEAVAVGVAEARENIPESALKVIEVGPIHVSRH